MASSLDADLQNQVVRKWAAKTGLSDGALRLATLEITRGLADADLGGGVLEKRVALPGRGRSGSTRILVVLGDGDAFLIYGFTKNQRDNINVKELEALRLLASKLLSYDDRSLFRATEAGELTEIDDG